jgi:hypothetical protein
MEVQALKPCFKFQYGPVTFIYNDRAVILTARTNVRHDGVRILR